MSIYGFCYIIGTLLVPHISSRIHKRFTLILSAFLIGVFFFLVGPSAIFGFDNSLTLTIVGLFLTAQFLAPTCIPVLPEVIAATQEKFPHCDQKVAGNYTAGLFNAGLGLGQILGPLYGASMYAAKGFRVTQDSIACICISFSILYFIFADGKSAFKDTLRGQTLPLTPQKSSIDFDGK